MKSLIVTADDCGLAPSVNRGILRAHRDGIVTATSLMANGRAFDDALERVREAPSLAVGIHVVLVDERPVLRSHLVKSLVDAHGRMPPSIPALMRGIVQGDIRRADVEREVGAQIAKLCAAGLTPTHLDSHQHAHVFPPIRSLILSIAQAAGIPQVRHTADLVAAKQSVAARELAELGRKLRLLVGQRGMSASDHFRGLGLSGRLDETSLLAILDTLPDGCTELMCHPGEAADTVASAYCQWRLRWSDELRGLTAPAVRALIAAQRVRLTRPPARQN